MDPHTQAEWVYSNVCLFTLQTSWTNYVTILRTTRKFIGELLEIATKLIENGPKGKLQLPICNETKYFPSCEEILRYQQRNWGHWYRKQELSTPWKSLTPTSVA